MRRKRAKYYNKKLSKFNEIKIPTELKDYYHVYQMYTIQLEDNKIREKLQHILTKARIMAKVYFEPTHLKTFYRKEYNYKEGDLPETEEISKKVLTIPLYPTLTNKEIDYIVDKLPPVIARLRDMSPFWKGQQAVAKA